MRDLLAVAMECMKELDDIQIPYGEVVDWKINTRAKKRWGQCKRLPNGCFEININYDLLREENSLKGLKETIIHELLHTCEGCMNHGKRWNELVSIINECYGYNIQRTSSAECKGVVVRREHNRAWKYSIECQSCHTVWKRKRMSSIIKSCKNGNARCTCGGKSFIVIEL